ncbi:DUF2085 domain-containing protein [Brevibacillus sp. NRS-1366]|uniref:DUF2085 domain-containing protein n=1 Tax=Brevibacillus sp. NRS-1366 TaxID=3233899 RepID=UPI003D1E8014
MRMRGWFAFLSYIPCHRLPERSLHVKGKQLPLCARCTAILLGYGSLPVLFWLSVPFPLFVGLLFQLPMLIDGLTQYAKWRESSNLLRVITGLLGGVGQSIVIVSAVAFLIDSLS